MAHVHSEYLEEEVGDQEGVQMEMVMEEPTNTDACILSESTDDTRKVCEDDMELKTDKKSTEKVFVHDNPCFQKIEKCILKYLCKQLGLFHLRAHLSCVFKDYFITMNILRVDKLFL